MIGTTVMMRPAGSAGGKEGFAILQHDGRCHRRQRPLARSDRVGPSPSRNVRHARLHRNRPFVVEEAGAGYRDAAAKREVRVYVFDTTLPSASITEWCVVWVLSREVRRGQDCAGRGALGRWPWISAA
jgi:hypothetical protein